MSDVGMAEGEDHLGKGNSRELSSTLESEALSRGGEGGVLCGWLGDDTCSGREGERDCLVDDRENKLRGISSRRGIYILYNEINEINYNINKSNYRLNRSCSPEKRGIE